MKKQIYIVSFTFLGLLLQLFIHAIVENWYIGLLLQNFDKYGFGLSWDWWYWFHFIATILLFVAGAVYGFRKGVYWWGRLYDDKGNLKNTNTQT